MVTKRSRSDFKPKFKWKNAAKAAFFAVFAGLLIFFGVILVRRLADSGKNEREALQDLWEASEYQKTYAESLEKLKSNPMDFFLLTLRGFSAYQLAVAQINANDIQNYIDDCIWSLRKALLLTEAQNDGRVYYVLGKAYYEKGEGYADLAVKYLEKGRSLDFYARDIPQYLGLSYAAIQDYRASVAAFSLALNDSDLSKRDGLLIAIANSYYALGDTASAQAYLIRCADTSLDSKSVSAARLRLGIIHIETGNSAAAEEQFRLILDDGDENADAHYYLGELYLAAGDSTRARAEWRNAVRIDPAHRLARARLNG